MNPVKKAVKQALKKTRHPAPRDEICVTGNNGNLYISYHGKRFGAYLNITANQQTGEGTIDGIAIDPQYRCRGLGRELVKATEQLLEQLGMKQISIRYNANPMFWQHMEYEPPNYTKTL